MEKKIEKGRGNHPALSPQEPPASYGPSSPPPSSGTTAAATTSPSSSTWASSCATSATRPRSGPFQPEIHPRGKATPRGARRDGPSLCHPTARRRPGTRGAHGLGQWPASRGVGEVPPALRARLHLRVLRGHRGQRRLHQLHRQDRGCGQSQRVPQGEVMTMMVGGSKR